MKDEVCKRVALLRDLGWQPRLVSVDIGDSAAASLFIKNQQRACTEVGIEYENRHYPANVTQREMLAAIHALNADPRVTGIILQRPVPKTSDLEALENAIHPSKDVEGMSSANIGINLIEVTKLDGTKGTRTVGDVDFNSVHEVAGWITPVPGGVGPMTVAMLLRNTVVATERQKKRYEDAMRE